MAGFLKRIWWFLWKSNHPLSWIANIVIAFVVIKFVFYPLLGFLLGTSYPIVAVVSGSMEHDGDFEKWWNSIAVCSKSACLQKDFYMEHNITKEVFMRFPFKNGFNKGDIMILVGVEPEELKIGDILVFRDGQKDPIIHRIVKKWKVDGKWYFQTKGDHNLQSITGLKLNEVGISEERIVGKAVFRIPYLGWIKILFVKFIGLFKGR